MEKQMRKLNNCRQCGKSIKGTKYNPYNESFQFYECKDDEKKMCLTCAEKFVKEQNKYKGGRWIVKTCDNEHICPICKCEEVTAIYYSCPAQADCKNCGHRYEFGAGIRILGLAEGMKKRPQLYEGYICEQCGGYIGPIDNMDALSEEDLKVLCRCMCF